MNPMASGSIGIVLSGMVAGLGSLEDSRYQVVSVTDTGMHGIDGSRSGSAEKHSRWNHQWRKVPLISLCSQ